MPKTFTDDVQAAFPSSIEGPLLIVDPADHDNWIKIDPATANIEAAGGARPTRILTVPFLRTYSSTTATLVGQVFPAHYVTAVTTGGFHGVPFLIPSDMDVSQPSRVKILVSPFADATGSGMVVRFSLGETHLRAGEAPNEVSITYDWGAPTDWSVNDPRLLTIDEGSGHTFDGGTFEVGDHASLRIARVGAATEDTFDKSVNFADYLLFEYAAIEY